MDGPRTVEVCRLEDGDMAVCVLNLGAITQGWWIAHRGGLLPIVLGYSKPQSYLSDPNYLGAIVGRVANRTLDGQFHLDGQAYQLTANEGPTHLHGGPGGLSTRLWDMEPDAGGRRVELRYSSVDGEEGYPGTAQFRIEIALQGRRLTYTMEAIVDRPTPINLAQHNYYNLEGHGDISGHALRCRAKRYTPANDIGIPTGAIESVAGTPADFRASRSLADDARMPFDVDLNLVFDEHREDQDPDAVLSAKNGLTLRLWTDQPGLQIYTGSKLRGVAEGHENQSLGAYAGLCLEPQGFPNALNAPLFPSIIVTPDHPYRQVLTLEVGDGSA